MHSIALGNGQRFEKTMAHEVNDVIREVGVGHQSIHIILSQRHVANVSIAVGTTVVNLWRPRPLSRHVAGTNTRAAELPSGDETAMVTCLPRRRRIVFGWTQRARLRTYVRRTSATASSRSNNKRAMPSNTVFARASNEPHRSTNNRAWRMSERTFVTRYTTHAVCILYV